MSQGKKFSVFMVLILMTGIFVPRVYADELPMGPYGDEEAAMPSEEGTAMEEPAPPPSIFDRYPPDIQVTMWGTQTKIVVTANPKMKKENRLAINSIQLEKLDGEFLGLMGYAPGQEERAAKFLVDRNILPIDQAKVILKSNLDGEWSTIINLDDLTETPEETVRKTAEKRVSRKIGSEKPPTKKGEKKKGWFWW